jgi:ketosteroid isomerase-like protein
MAHPNTETIEKAYAAFAVGDIETIMGMWADDVAWHEAGNNPLVGDHVGKEAVAAFLGGVMQNTGGTFKAELQHALADDASGYSLHKATATRDGEDLESWSVLGYRFDEGQIAEIWGFHYDHEILDRILS